MQEHTPITYDAARRMDRAESLMLGVAGRDAAAAARRLAVAHHLAADWNRVADEAYRSAHGMPEPWVPEPFGLSALIEAGGNVQAVVDSPDFDRLVLEDLRLGASEMPVSDEDGTRYEWVTPSADDWETARREAARIRDALVARGDIDADRRRLHPPEPDQASHPLRPRAETSAISAAPVGGGAGRQSSAATSEPGQPIGGMNVTLYDSGPAVNLATALSTNDALPSAPVLVERTVIATGGLWQPRGWDADLRRSGAPIEVLGLHTAPGEPVPSSRAWARLARIVTKGCRWEHTNWVAVRTDAQSMLLVAETDRRPTHEFVDAVARVVSNWHGLTGRSHLWGVPPGAGVPPVGAPLQVLDARFDAWQRLAVLVSQVPDLHQLRFTPHTLPPEFDLWSARHPGPDTLYVAQHLGGYLRFLLDTGNGQGFNGEPFDLHLVDGSSRVVVGPWSSKPDMVARNVPEADIHTEEVILHDNPDDFRTGRGGRIAYLTRTTFHEALSLATSPRPVIAPGRAAQLPDRSAGTSTIAGSAGNRIHPPRLRGPGPRAP